VDDCAPRPADRCLAIVTNVGLIRDRLDVRLPDAIVAPALLMVWLVYSGMAHAAATVRHRARASPPVAC
jgi:hypothetical protein